MRGMRYGCIPLIDLYAQGPLSSLSKITKHPPWLCKVFDGKQPVVLTHGPGLQEGTAAERTFRLEAAQRPTHRVRRHKLWEAEQACGHARARHIACGNIHNNEQLYEQFNIRQEWRSAVRRPTAPPGGVRGEMLGFVSRKAGEREAEHTSAPESRVHRRCL